MKNLSNVGIIVALLVPTLGISLLFGAFLVTRAIYRKLKQMFQKKDFIDVEFSDVTHQKLLEV